MHDHKKAQMQAQISVEVRVPEICNDYTVLFTDNGSSNSSDSGREIKEEEKTR